MPRLCFDRTVPPHLLVAAAHEAARENPRNLVLLDSDHPWAAGLHPDEPRRMALMVGKTWEPGRQLNVFFYGDVSTTLQARLMGVWAEWSQYANIGFAQASRESAADIRVTTKADPGSWSLIGTDCRMVPLGQPTMNYGWLDDSTDMVEVRRVGLHEMGHGIGCIHEHQNPNGGLVWDAAQVYADYSGAPNFWSRSEIDQNVLQKYSQTQLFSASFDATSIMEYPIAQGEATDAAGRPVIAGWNTDLSAEDRSFIAQIYPKAPAPVQPPGPPVQPPNPPSPPSPPTQSWPVLVPDGGPKFAQLTSPGQVIRLTLRVDRTAFYIVATAPATFLLNLSTMDGMGGVAGHGRGYFLGRLEPADYLLSAAAPPGSTAMSLGVACRRFGEAMAFA